MGGRRSALQEATRKLCTEIALNHGVVNGDRVEGVKEISNIFSSPSFEDIVNKDDGMYFDATEYDKL
ncbi:hypothetical protein EON65_44725 [archaeon]|nr:MAG: hypothetical protein EON65_44725 [archaeon]